MCTHTKTHTDLQCNKSQVSYHGRKEDYSFQRYSSILSLVGSELDKPARLTIRVLRVLVSDWQIWSEVKSEVKRQIGRRWHCLVWIWKFCIPCASVSVAVMWRSLNQTGNFQCQSHFPSCSWKDDQGPEKKQNKIFVGVVYVYAILY